MNQLRNASLVAVAFVLTVGAWVVPAGADDRRDQRQEKRLEKKQGEQQEEQGAPYVDPAVAAMLGSAVAAGRVDFLSTALRAGSLPAEGGKATADLPAFTALHAVAGGRYEASGFALDLAPLGWPRIRIENAHLALTPAADGKSCRFEVSGSPFDPSTKFSAAGTIEWGTGPAGGDKLDVTFALDDAPVEALRAVFPDRIDPSLRGSLRLHGKASGVVGEATTEDAPATPLRGDLDLGADWQVLGRTAPAHVTARFSLDDRMMRILDGSLAWQNQTLALSGWFDPKPGGKFDLSGKFHDVDTAKVAADWNVPEPWRPASMLSGTIRLSGTPGKSLLQYEADAASIVIPTQSSYTVRIESPKVKGNILAVNTDISASLRAPHTRIGPIDIVDVPMGAQWWRQLFTVTTQGTPLWGGTNEASVAFRPAEAPAWLFNARLTGANPHEVIAGLVPWLRLDVDGTAHLTCSVGEDRERRPILTAHSSIVSGRIGGIDFFPRVLEEMAKAAPGLDAKGAATLVPPPRRGSGTRADLFFFESAASGDAYDIGGMVLRTGNSQLDADGRFDPATGLAIDGAVIFAEDISARLVASAPWLSALLFEGKTLIVPVAIGGSTAAPTVALGPGYAALLESARRGEAVTAPGIKRPRHVGESNLAAIPGDPNFVAPE